MTIVDVYIGRLSAGPDPLDWGGAPPPNLSGFFPPTQPHPCYALLEAFREGRLPGRQVDWGASAASVTKQQIVAFIDETYRGDETYIDPAKSPHLYPKLGELRRFVETLTEERYALVAIEL